MNSSLFWLLVRFLLSSNGYQKYANWRGLWIPVIVKYVPFQSIFDSLSGNRFPTLLSLNHPSTRWSSSSRSLIVVPAPRCLSARPMRRETVSWKFGVRERGRGGTKALLPSFGCWPIASLRSSTDSWLQFVWVVSHFNRSNCTNYIILLLGLLMININVIFLCSIPNL